MKKSILIICLIATSCWQLIAQDPEFKPATGAMGVAIGISNPFANPSIGTFFTPTAGNTGTLVFKKVMKNDMAARVGLIFMNSTLVAETDTTGLGTMTTTTTKASTIILSVGGEKHMWGGARLDPYIAVDVFYGLTNGNLLVATEVTGINGGVTLGDMTSTETTNVGKGTVLGLNFGVGVNYFITRNFALGTEFTWGWLSTSASAGETIVTVSGSGETFGPPSSTTTNSTLAGQTSGLAPAGGGALVINYFFK